MLRPLSAKVPQSNGSPPPPISPLPKVPESPLARQTKALDADYYRVLLYAYRGDRTIGINPGKVTSGFFPKARTQSSPLYMAVPELFTPDFDEVLLGLARSKAIVADEVDRLDEAFFTRTGLLTLEPVFHEMNKKGYTVAITPFSRELYYMLLDDVSPAGVSRLLMAGALPRTSIETSANNYQVVLTTHRLTGGVPWDGEAANAAMRALNQQYQGDPKVSGGVTRPMAAAGFLNKKPSRNNFLRRLDFAAERPDICPVATKILAGEREVLAKTSAALQTRRALPATGHPLGDPMVAWTTAYTYSQSLTDDRSAQDFRAVLRMLGHGFSPEVVADCLEHGSENLVGRKGRRSRLYAERTVARAGKVLGLPGPRSEPGVPPSAEVVTDTSKYVMTFENSRGIL